MAVALQRFVLITGCSGGGKSTLIAELGRRGYSVVPEPGRRIVRAERASGGNALPWIDMAAFADRAIGMARADLADAANLPGPVFFDRGLIDAALAARTSGGTDVSNGELSSAYGRIVFVAPPWPEIRKPDPDRQLGMDAAISEYDALCRLLPTLGYVPVELPKTSPRERADFVLARLP